MNKDQLLKYLTVQAKQLGYDNSEIEDYLTFVINNGSEDLWNRSDWSFRTRSYSFTTTNGTVSYQMPEDFEGVQSARNTSSQDGNDIDIYSKEEFDSLVPKPAAHTSNYVQAMAFYYNNNEGRWYGDCFPPPNGDTIVMQIATNMPPSLDAFPNKSNAALIASCLRLLHKSGSSGRIAAVKEYENEVRKLEVSDGPFKGKLFRVKDDTDTQIYTERLWL